MGIFSNALFDYLTVACSLSDRVVVVTNSKRPWVSDCINRFLPNIQPFLQRETGGIRIVYAAETIMHPSSARPVRLDSLRHTPTQVEMDSMLTFGKMYAMRRECRDFYIRYPKQSWKNLIGIGDMNYEHDALQEVAFIRNSPKREQLRNKIVRLCLSPSISAMTMQLSIGRLTLPAIVKYDGDLDIDLRGSAQSQICNFAQALQMADLTNIDIPAGLDMDPQEKMPPPCDKDVEQLIDNIAVIVHQFLTD